MIATYGWLVLAFPLLGAWLAWELLTPVLTRLATTVPGEFGEWLAEAPEWVIPAAAALAGAVVGWFVAAPLLSPAPF